MIKIAVVDDEKDILDFISDIIKYTLSENNLTAELYSFTDSGKMLENNKTEKYDIVFLDLEMPYTDGIKTAEILRKDSPEIIIVIVSNREDLVFDTFKYDVSAFVRKKYFEQEIDAVVERVYKKATGKSERYLIKTDKGEKYFFANDIVYIESENHNVYLYNSDGEKFKIFSTLEKISSLLSDEIFVRCHSGIVVSCKYIFSVNTDNVELTTGKLLPVSRSRKKEVKSVFQRFIRSV